MSIQSQFTINLIRYYKSIILKIDFKLNVFQETKKDNLIRKIY